MALCKQEEDLHILQNLSQRQNRSSKGIYGGFFHSLEIYSTARVVATLLC